MLCHLFNMFKQFSVFAKEITAFEQNDNDNGNNDSVLSFFRAKSLANNKLSIRASAHPTISQWIIPHTIYLFSWLMGILMNIAYFWRSPFWFIVTIFIQCDITATTATENSALVQLNYMDISWTWTVLMWTHMFIIAPLVVGGISNG